MRDKEFDNIAIIDNCTFKGNSASESGAAVSLSSQLFFGTKEKIPNVMFSDW